MSNAYRSVLESGVTATGDAVAADVLTGKTFSNANAVGIAGAMVNNGAVTQTIAGGQSYTIPEGYHNGNGTVTASTPVVLASESWDTPSSDATITVYTATEAINCTLVASIVSRPSDTSGGTITIKQNNTVVLTVTATGAETNAFDTASISLSANDVLTMTLARAINAGRVDGNCTVIKT